ncbi:MULTISPECIES: hypothetical protein [unclassified Coleofasciculus]|uniref:hypothetical protein n=1 Tax=unclassified Coleofasciculus TaxID=2692782 RepID=UPI001881241F|nr:MULTISPECIES: hypothetical protein [unclassified Coleofasciculus]MBE9126608.1 hypothetical protein [Coleofasciculus sp. LEGE 07081]MBE9148860.1 hypothetical protein [Coleofasciculus sp. LEGE 07092]
MLFFQRTRQFFTALALVLLLATTSACQASQTQTPTALNPSITYQQLEKGNSPAGQEFGNWVVQTAKGLISDAYVRDNDKLGVVITPKVRPQEAKDLAKSLVQGFHQNFPNRDLKVLMYAPDKQLILTANYDNQLNQVTYQ